MSGSPNRAYLIHASENLSAWVGIGSINTDGSGTGVFTDPSASAHPHRFYKATE
jgi:hypothetical protein